MIKTRFLTLRAVSLSGVLQVGVKKDSDCSWARTSPTGNPSNTAGWGAGADAARTFSLVARAPDSPEACPGVGAAAVPACPAQPSAPERPQGDPQAGLAGVFSPLCQETRLTAAHWLRKDKTLSQGVCRIDGPADGEGAELLESHLRARARHGLMPLGPWSPIQARNGVKSKCLPGAPAAGDTDIWGLGLHTS